MENILLKQVCKAYGPRILFNDLNLTFKAGATTCITGPSGCGKTTLLKMLMGLDMPDSGEILGIDRISIAPVFQEDRLCEYLSVSKNASMALKRGASSKISDDILSELGLGTSLTKPVSTLSGGQRRRVALARALAAESDLIILDEPFTGLDPATRTLAIDCIQRHTREKTVICVSHDWDSMAHWADEHIQFEFFIPSQM